MQWSAIGVDGGLAPRYTQPMGTLSFTSTLTASSERVWAHASTLAGVNEELWPLHMSGGRGLSLGADTPLRRPVVRSVLSLGRLVPLDVHTLIFAEVWPGRGFREDSHSLLQRRWIHVRRIEPRVGGGCVIRDELQFAPRMGSRTVTRAVAWVFGRRHRLLRKKFREAALGEAMAVPVSP